LKGKQQKMMKNIFVNDYFTILREWHELKERLKRENSNPSYVLQEIMNFFSLAPITTIIIDHEDPSTWLTPWELLKFNEYDQFAKTYMIAETYEMIMKNSMKIHVINNMKEKRMDYLAIDEKNGICMMNCSEIRKLEDVWNLTKMAIRTYEKKDGRWMKA